MGSPLPDPPFELQPGSNLAGKYEIVRELGKGGMGVVYEARHLRLGQPVAIKMLLPKRMPYPEMRVRFEREARALVQLQSEHAARVLDIDTLDNDHLYLVMELLRGHDLSDELAQRGPLPWGEALEIIFQACDAMDEAHGKGIIHRDLKPSNLFLADRKGQRLVKVLDFGLAKVNDGEDPRITMPSLSIGTPAYMSPEQVRDGKDVDGRCDVWALGVILHEMLSGRSPFQRDSSIATVAAVMVDPPPALAALRPELPAGLEQAIQVALAKDREQRYPSIQALVAALSAFATPSQAPPPSGPASSSSYLRAGGVLPLPGAETATLMPVVRREIKGPNYRVWYDSTLDTVSFEGSMRTGGQDYEAVRELLDEVLARNPRGVTLDMRALQFMNSSAMSVLYKFAILLGKQGDAPLLIRARKSIPWQGKSLPNIGKLNPRFELTLVD